MDKSLCYKNRSQVSGNCEVPHLYGFTFGIIVANSTVFTGGRDLYDFKMDSKKDFDVAVKDFKIISIGRNVEPADQVFFK